MIFELQVIVWSTTLLLALIMFQGVQVPINQGFGWGLGNRAAKRDFSALQGRTARTIANHIEGMLVFVPLILVAQLIGLSTELTTWGAGIYLFGRLAFALLYILGVPYLRSLAWGLSQIGVLLILFVLVRATI